MRVTEGMRYSQVLAKPGEHQLAAGRRRPRSLERRTGRQTVGRSDRRGELARLERKREPNQSASIDHDTVRGDAELTESSLSDASDIFVRLKELRAASANGNLTADERKSIGLETSGLKDALLALANTRGQRGYLFSGSQVTTAAFDTNGNFQGAIKRRSGDRQQHADVCQYQRLGMPSSWPVGATCSPISTAWPRR